MSVVRAAIPVSGLLGVVLLAVLAARAETPVNFSGTWQLDKGRSTLPSHTPAAPGDLTLVIEQNGVALKIERHFKILALRRTITATYYTDGREAVNTAPRTGQVTSRSHWEGKSLVTEHKSFETRNGKTEAVESTDVKHLSEDGTLLYIDNTVVRPGQDAPEKFRLVFVRR